MNDGWFLQREGGGGVGRYPGTTGCADFARDSRRRRARPMSLAFLFKVLRRSIGLSTGPNLYSRIDGSGGLAPYVCGEGFADSGYRPETARGLH